MLQNKMEILEDALTSIEKAGSFAMINEDTKFLFDSFKLTDKTNFFQSTPYGMKKYFDQN